MCAHVHSALCPPPLQRAGCLPSKAGPAPGWCADHPPLSSTLPSPQGPSPCFLSPGLSGLLALTALEPLGGWEGRWPSRPLPPPTRCCFPLWGSQGLFEDIFSLCDYFTLDAVLVCFVLFVFLTVVAAAGPSTLPHPLSTLLLPSAALGLRCGGWAAAEPWILTRHARPSGP